jgi:hypothetical protein
MLLPTACAIPGSGAMDDRVADELEAIKMATPLTSRVLRGLTDCTSDKRASRQPYRGIQHRVRAAVDLRAGQARSARIRGNR